MRWIVASAVAVLLVIGLMAFSRFMAGKAAEWERRDQALPVVLVVLVNAALLVRVYWLIILPAVVALCLGAAALVGQRETEE